MEMFLRESIAVTDSAAIKFKDAVLGTFHSDSQVEMVSIKRSTGKPVDLAIILPLKMDSTTILFYQHL